MIINGHDFPSIGLIRAKPIGNRERFTLTIYPPSPGPLAGAEPATMVEIEVDEDEVRRIDRAAPHLLVRGVMGAWIV
jgi:hypothetical protein